MSDPLPGFKNEVRLGQPGQLVVKLTQGKEMVVDDSPEARKLLAEHKWCFSKSSKYCSGRVVCYDITKTGQSTAKFHRLLMGDIPTDKVVDHIDGDGLNNTKANLRLIDQHVNALNRGMSKVNTSGVTGVCRDDSCRHHRWIVQYAPSSYKTASRTFSDGKFGGRDKSFQAAVAFRTLIEQTEPLYKEALSHPATRSSKYVRPKKPLKVQTVTTITKKIIKKEFE